MTCDEIYELLSAKLDDALTEQEEQQLRAHLDACEDCRRLYDAMFSIEEKTRALEQPAPEGLKRGVMYQIQQAAGGAKKSKRRFWGVGTGLGLAAAVLVMLVGTGFIKLPKPARTVSNSNEQAYTEPAPEKSLAGDSGMHFVPSPDKEDKPQTNEPAETEPAEAPQTESPWIIDPGPVWENDSQFYYEDPEPAGPEDPGDPVIVTQSPAAEPDPWTSMPNSSALETEPVTEPVRRPPDKSDGQTDSVDPAAPVDPDAAEEPFIEPEQPVTDELNEACLELSETSKAPVLLYTEFSFESMLCLLEQEEPELYEALNILEPMTLDEFLSPSEDEDPAGKTEEAPPVEEPTVPPVVPDWAMPGSDDAQAEDEEPEPVPPEERILVCEADYQTLLALHEWMLQRIPRAFTPDLDLIGAELSVSLQMEELDPDNQSLRRVITWDRPTGPVAWPEFWAEDWVTRFRAAQNWALFFPDTEYTPEAEDPALLVFLAPLEEEPLPERETESEPEPETEPDKR